jgi:16S rRNA (guanine527-N7)-methyltransferase
MARPAPSDGPEAVAAVVPLTAAARGRLEAYAALLRRWQPVKNLVAPSTLGEIWRRHMADSAQILPLVPGARRFLDLGSGAGFPGLVLAVLLAETPGARVTLVESNQRKAAFLRTVARELGLPATVRDDRIEAVAADRAAIGPVDVVTARALADLTTLFALAEPWLGEGSLGLFHKGRDFDLERQAAAHAWRFDLVEHDSAIGGGGRIAVVRSLARRAPGAAEAEDPSKA